MYRYAIIGFGGLGRVHLANLDKINSERGDLSLCGICGTTKEKFCESVSINLGTTDCSHIDIANCNFYDDYKELIDKEKPDFVVSALPTYLHEEVAVYALSHGVHILSEKPMALSVESCERMIKASVENNVVLMVGQSCRFLPAVKKIKEYIEQGTFGKPCRADFSRYSQTPLWTWNNWILDPEMSGGCIVDMHVHDVDMINYLFGKPVSVHSVMTENKVPLESIFTQYILENGMIVTTGADWSLPQKFPFEDNYFVNFEKACAKIDGDKLIVYTDDEVIIPDIGTEESHLAEMREFVDCVVNNKPSTTIPTESVLMSIKVALAEKESAQTGKTVMI